MKLFKRYKETPEEQIEASGITFSGDIVLPHPAIFTSLLPRGIDALDENSLSEAKALWQKVGYINVDVIGLKEKLHDVTTKGTPLCGPPFSDLLLGESLELDGQDPRFTITTESVADSNNAKHRWYRICLQFSYPKTGDKNWQSMIRKRLKARLISIPIYNHEPSYKGRRGKSKMTCVALSCLFENSPKYCTLEMLNNATSGDPFLRIYKSESSDEFIDHFAAILILANSDLNLNNLDASKHKSVSVKDGSAPSQKMAEKIKNVLVEPYFSNGGSELSGRLVWQPEAMSEYVESIARWNSIGILETPLSLNTKNFKSWESLEKFMNVIAPTSKEENPSAFVEWLQDPSRIFAIHRPEHNSLEVVLDAGRYGEISIGRMGGNLVAGFSEYFGQRLKYESRHELPGEALLNEKTAALARNKKQEHTSDGSNVATIMPQAYYKANLGKDSKEWDDVVPGIYSSSWRIIPGKFYMHPNFKHDGDHLCLFFEPIPPREDAGILDFIQVFQDPQNDKHATNKKKGDHTQASRYIKTSAKIYEAYAKALCTMHENL